MSRINDDGRSQSPPSSLRALVVEDQDDLREIVSAMVEELGFEVTPASNADVAYALLTANGRFDLLVTDVNMPGSLDGTGLVEAAQKIDETMAVIVVTGCIGGFLAKLPSNVAILRKPFRMEELFALIDQKRPQPDGQENDVVA